MKSIFRFVRDEFFPPHLCLLVIQLFLQTFQKVLLLAGWSSADPQLPLRAQGGAHLAGLGSLRLQLDLKLLEAPVEAQLLPLDLLAEAGGGLALLLQGGRQALRLALLLLQNQIQVLANKVKSWLELWRSECGEVLPPVVLEHSLRSSRRDSVPSPCPTEVHGLSGSPPRVAHSARPPPRPSAIPRPCMQ